MRSLKRNQKHVYFAEYGGMAPILDDEGYSTGEKEPIYGKPKQIRITVSPPKGSVYSQPFGDLVDYTSVLTTTDNLPVDEQTVWWVDADPREQHDYVTKRVAKSLN